MRNARGFEVVNAIAPLDENFQRLNNLLDLAEQELGRGRLRRAAVQAQIAATFAWFNHCGIFVSIRLEEILRTISTRLSGPTGSQPTNSASPQRILHVATQVYPTGGHTQMIAKWLELDAGREHRVCLTAQGPAPVTSKIAEKVAGENLVLLDRKKHDLLSRAVALRREALWADRIILHVHPNDVVASIALSAFSGPPSILVNHADHVFWVGVSSADVVMNLRESGARLAADRRGVEPGRNLTFTRPLQLRERTLTRAAAKRALGVPSSKIVIATAAAASKYEPINRIGFLDLISPTLRSHAESYLVAAGPSPTGRWDELLESGRLGKALGELPDVSTLMQAADIYVDSFPFASLTSMLEAASFGVPVVSYRAESAECAVLGADTPELDSVMLDPSSPEKFDQVMSDLVLDASYRKERGFETLSKLKHAHGENAWPRRLEDLYRQADNVSERQPILSAHAARLTSELDRRVRILQLQTGYGMGEKGSRAVHMSILPFTRRLDTWWWINRSGTDLRLSQLLSARQRRWLESAWQGRGDR